MKQHISSEDLNALQDSKVQNLRGMWLPEVNTLAVARICKDVIKEEYDDIIFVIGEVIVTEGGSLVLRRLKLVDEMEQDFDEVSSEEAAVLSEDEIEYEYTEPEQYFLKEDCLPLLSIGQMISLLQKIKYGQDGFVITIPPARKMIGDKGFSVMNRNDYEFEEEELCDALWNAVAQFL